MPLVRDGQSEIIVVDSGSTDRTVEIAKSFGAHVFIEPWKGFAAQKNSAMEKGSGDWVLQLDADESLEPGLAGELYAAVHGRIADDFKENDSFATIERIIEMEETGKTGATGGQSDVVGFYIPRKNFFLGRWIKHGGFYPDPKLRLIRRGAGKFEEYGSHPTIKVKGPTGQLKHALIHKAYPTLRGYIDHMNSYSSSGAEVAVKLASAEMKVAGMLSPTTDVEALAKRAFVHLEGVSDEWLNSLQVEKVAGGQVTPATYAATCSRVQA